MPLTNFITQLKKQDPCTQDQFYRQYARPMMCICMEYLRNRPLAEEVLMNGFYAAFKYISTLKSTDQRGMFSWLKKIFINECLKELNKKQLLIVATEKEIEEVGINNEALNSMSMADIMILVARLPEGYRIIFTLSVIDGYNHQEIGNMLNISIGNSKVQVSRAKNYFQKILISERKSYAAK